MPITTSSLPSRSISASVFSITEPIGFESTTILVNTTGSTLPVVEVTAAVRADVALEEPSLFEPVTTTLNVKPSSPLRTT